MRSTIYSLLIISLGISACDEPVKFHHDLPFDPNSEYYRPEGAANIVIEQIDEQTLHLEWINKSVAADYFVLKRRVNDMQFEEIATLPSDSTSYLYTISSYGRHVFNLQAFNEDRGGPNLNSSGFLVSHWKQGPSRNHPGYKEKSVLLPDGRVLVISPYGGISVFIPNVGMVSSIAEIYDPEANGWEMVPALSLNDFHSFDLYTLPDQKIIAAGITNNFFSIRQLKPDLSGWTDIASYDYNPSRDQFPYVSSTFKSVMAGGDRMFLIARRYRTNRFSPTDPLTLMYDIKSGDFKLIDNKPEIENDVYFMLPLNDGFMIGTGFSNAISYDPNQDSWTEREATQMPVYSQGTYYMELKDGNMLLIGNQRIQVYNTTLNERFGVPGMHVLKSGFYPGVYVSASSYIPDGRILIVGPKGSPSFIFDPENYSFTAIDSETDISYPSTATTLKNGNIMATGGPYASTNYRGMAIFRLNPEF